MRIALISDIHGNLEALEAVLESVSLHGVDRIVCLGDVVSFGPLPRECVERIMDLRDIVWIRGNHDRYISDQTFASEAFSKGRPPGFVENEAWTRSQLTQVELDALGSLEPAWRSQIESVPLLLVHASLASDEAFLWPDSAPEDYGSLLGTGGVRAFGHIHRQFKRTIGETVYCNPGSVGLPFDGDRRASYAILTLTPGERRVDLVRVEYDSQKTVAALRERRAPWFARIRAALEQSLSFFDPQLVRADEE